MGPKRKTVGLVLMFLAAAAMPLGALRYGESARGMNPLTRWACTTERREKLNGIAGWNFEIVRESCDLVGKQDVITVYGSPAGWAGWFTQQKVVFRYEPVDAENAWPYLRADRADKVVIAVPQVSAVLVENRTMGELHVAYAIGRTELPPGAEPQPAP